MHRFLKGASQRSPGDCPVLAIRIRCHGGRCQLLRGMKERAWAAEGTANRTLELKRSAGARGAGRRPGHDRYLVIMFNDVEKEELKRIVNKFVEQRRCFRPIHPDEVLKEVHQFKQTEGGVEEADSTSAVARFQL